VREQGLAKAIFPGFTGEASLYQANTSYATIAVNNSVDNSVYPAQCVGPGGCTDGYTSCVSECIVCQNQYAWDVYYECLASTRSVDQLEKCVIPLEEDQSAIPSECAGECSFWCSYQYQPPSHGPRGPPKF
jgi:hypothetical protein